MIAFFLPKSFHFPYYLFLPSFTSSPPSPAPPCHPSSTDLSLPPPAASSALPHPPHRASPKTRLKPKPPSSYYFKIPPRSLAAPANIPISFFRPGACPAPPHNPPAPPPAPPPPPRPSPQGGVSGALRVPPGTPLEEFRQGFWVGDGFPPFSSLPPMCSSPPPLSPSIARPWRHSMRLRGRPFSACAPLPLGFSSPPLLPLNNRPSFPAGWFHPWRSAFPVPGRGGPPVCFLLF